MKKLLFGVLLVAATILMPMSAFAGQNTSIQTVYILQQAAAQNGLSFDELLSDYENGDISIEPIEGGHLLITDDGIFEALAEDSF